VARSAREEATPGGGGYELRVVLLLGLAYGFAFFDRQALVYLGPAVQQGLNLTNEQLGWANSGLSATWALGAFVVGRWSDAIGLRKPFLLGALVLFSVCSVLSGLAWSFGTLLAARIVMGLAEGPFLPICLAIIAAASAESRRGLNSGIVQNTFGSIIGNALAPIILVRLAAAYGWHSAFFLAGIPGLVLAFLIWRFIDEPERATVVDAASRPSLGAMLARRNIWLCAIVSCLAVGSVVIGSIFMQTYIEGPLGFDPLTRGNIMFVVGFSPALGGILVAWLSDAFGRKPPLVFFALLMALAPAALRWFHGPVAILTALIFVSWTGLGTFPLFMGVIPGETIGRGLAATAMGLVVMIGELTGGVFGPPIAGRLADWFGLDVPLYIQMGMALAAGMVALFVVETNPRVLARRALRRTQGAPR
jgi:predicted MFS family arabinose efflux permease